MILVYSIICYTFLYIKKNPVHFYNNNKRPAGLQHILLSWIRTAGPVQPHHRNIFQFSNMSPVLRLPLRMPHRRIRETFVNFEGVSVARQLQEEDNVELMRSSLINKIEKINIGIIGISDM